MPQEFIHFINQYGYFAIFALIFIQEIGIPTPIPNELLMLFSGYLSFNGTLNLYLLLLTVISADFLGASVLYTTFYFFGPYLISHKPKWFPLSTERINKLSGKIAKRGLGSVFLGRVTPFIRGYMSVIVGLLHIKPKSYVPIALLSSCLVTCTYTLTGHFLGPYWEQVAAKLTTIKYGIFFIIAVIACYFVIRYFRNKKFKHASTATQETKPLDS
ncbi:MAG: DedA family protein [Mucilaginibacter sp.]|uniref:DedA family protein n=1 Tax=Mucilaginibacter sp. TaxID=1882438 RepID=UPI0034E5D9B0